MLILQALMEFNILLLFQSISVISAAGKIEDDGEP